MSRAIKCDRCGEFCREIDAYKIGGKGILSEVPKDHYYPESQDLCTMCGDQLWKILKNWWRGQEFKGREMKHDCKYHGEGEENKETNSWVLANTHRRFPVPAPVPETSLYQF